MRFFAGYGETHSMRLFAGYGERRIQCVSLLDMERDAFNASLRCGIYPVANYRDCERYNWKWW